MFILDELQETSVDRVHRFLLKGASGFLFGMPDIPPNSMLSAKDYKCVSAFRL